MLDLLTNAPREVSFGPRKFLVGALKLRELGYLQRWIRDHSVRPTVALKETIGLYEEEDRRAATKAAVMAERNWPPQVNTVEGNTVLFEDPEGQLFFLGVMLKKFQPALTDEEVNTVAEGISEVDFGVLVQIAFGEDDLDPKAVREAAIARLEMVRAVLLERLGQDPVSTGESSSPPTGTSESESSPISSPSSPSLSS